MNHTSAMVELLGAFRRERNGLVADTMHYVGARYGLNYGVSLPTVRQLVRRYERDQALAHFLFGQDVRCLKLAALHLADPDGLADPAEADFWLAGIQNSELAEEAAFALFGRSKQLHALFEARFATAEPLQRYLLLMAAARSATPDPRWLDATLTALAQAADHPYLRLLTDGTITLWAAIGLSSDEGQKQAAERVASLGVTDWERRLREEVSWRLSIAG